jgi:hypothetical protein
MILSKELFALDSTILGSIDPDGESPSQFVTVCDGFNRMDQAGIKDDNSSITGMYILEIAAVLGIVGSQHVSGSRINSQGTSVLIVPVVVAIQNASVMTEIASNSGFRFGRNLVRERVVAMCLVKSTLSVFGQLNTFWNGQWLGIGCRIDR